MSAETETHANSERKRAAREAVELLALPRSQAWTDEMRRNAACFIMVRSVHRQASLLGVDVSYSELRRGMTPQQPLF